MSVTNLTNVKTDTATSQDTTSPKARANGFLTSAGLRVLTGVHTSAASTPATTNDTAQYLIDIGDLPVGSQLIPDKCVVTSEGVGGTTGVIAKIGDDVDDDRYSATAIPITAAGIVAVTPTNAIMLTPFSVTEATKRLKATVTLAAGPFTAGKKVRFDMVYKMPGH